MKHKLSIIGFFILIVVSQSAVVFGASRDLQEGEYEVYILKQVIECTGFWSSISWDSSPEVAFSQREVVEGSDSAGLDYYWDEVSNFVRKEDETKVVIEVESLLLENESASTITVSKGANGYIQLSLYAWDVVLGDYVSVDGVYLGEGDTGPIAWQPDMSELNARPCTTVELQDNIHELDGMVMAFYYQWYSRDVGPSGRQVHWEGYEYTPLFGLYDSYDDRVIYAQMEMAKHAGIDGLIVDWPYYEYYEDDFMPKLLQAAEDVGLVLSEYGVQAAYVDEHLRDTGHSSYLKDGGRPVFFQYGPDNASPDEWIDYILGLEEEIGPIIYIANTNEVEYLGAFDALHAYCYVTGGPDDDGYEWFLSNIERCLVGPKRCTLGETFAKVKDAEPVELELKPFFVTVLPGFDDSSIRDPPLIRDRMDGDHYRRLWETALELKSPVLITSWNELHEGTDIEPSEELGWFYLNMTRRYIEEYKGSVVAPPNGVYAASVDPLILGSDGDGRGRILVTAEGDALVYVNVSVSGGEGVSDVSLGGDFYCYKEERTGSGHTILVPSVYTGNPLEVTLDFQASSGEPILDIKVTGFTPVGDEVDVLAEQMVPRVTPSLTCKASQSEVLCGSQVMISGNLGTTLPGEQVTVTYIKPDGSIIHGTVITNSEGGYTDTHVPEDMGEWRVQASWRSDDGFESSSSPEIGFSVFRIDTQVLLQVNPSSIQAGEAVTISGEITPSVRDVTLDLEITPHDGGALKSTSSTDSDGKFSRTETISEPGVYSVKASWGGDVSHHGSESETVSFEVEVKETPSGEEAKGIPGFPYASIILGLIIALVFRARRSPL